MSNIHGDRDLFEKPDREFDMRRFNRAGKKLDQQLKGSGKSSKRPIPKEFIIGGLALVVLVYLLWPRSEITKIRKRVSQIFASFKSISSASDLPQYLDETIDVEIRAGDYSVYSDSFESVAAPRYAIAAIRQHGAIRIVLAAPMEVLWKPDVPEEATVEGWIDLQGSGLPVEGPRRAAFRFKMVKKQEKGWVLKKVEFPAAGVPPPPS